MAQVVRTQRPVRLRHRLGRVLLRDLLPRRRWRRTAGRPRSRVATGPRRLQEPDRADQPVQTLERARPALGLRHGRRRLDEGLPALPHLPRQRHEPRRAEGQHRRLERRGPRDREPRALPPEVRARHAPAGRGHERGAARCRLLPVGRGARPRLWRQRRGFHARTAGSIQCRGAAWQLPRPRGQWGQPRPRSRAHGAGGGRRRMRRSRRAHPRVHPHLPALTASAPAEVRDAVNHIIDALDTGKLRVAEKVNGAWETHQWIKKAVLLSFRLNDNVPMGDGALQFYDKVPTKYAGMSAEQLKATGVRVVPPAVARRRSFQAQSVIVEENSVISMGVYIGQSTKIYDRATGEVTYGRIPAGSVVVSGNLPSADGKYSLYCAVIVKRVDAHTRSKTSINDLLRGA